MAHFIYNRLIWLASLVLKGLKFFNEKIKKGVLGRSESFSVLEKNISTNNKTIWFHCASLGEYEQGLPVFKEIRKVYPNHKIVLSFFSPSGYEIRKNSPVADVVIYLPLDSIKNAKKFIKLLKPELSIFVKYDVWPNYLIELKKHKLKSILISAAFRPNQIYFKWYGKLFKNALASFNHIFTQNVASIKRLHKIGIKNCSLAGDTRYDRVSNQLNINNTLAFIENFKADKLLVVIGSSWLEDEQLYLNYINTSGDDVKFLIAPHEINAAKIENLQKKISQKSLLYTELETRSPETHKVFILNTIGLLSKAYSYADIAYVGGAAGHTGLHNILEPATFGIPILFGKNHHKFPEAQALINAGGALSISSPKEFNLQLNKLLLTTNYRSKKGKSAQKFVTNQTGATNTIINCIKNKF